MANEDLVALQAQDAVEPDVAPTEVNIPTVEELQEQHNPEDAAAAFFKMHEGSFPGLVNQLTLNQALRVIKHVCFGGLSEKEYKLVDNLERQVAYKFNEIVTQRFVMQMALEMQKAEEAHRNEQQPMPEGETNG